MKTQERDRGTAICSPGSSTPHEQCEEQNRLARRVAIL